MPCDTLAKTAAEKKAREDALKEFEADLVAGRLRVTRNAKGELSVPDFAKTSAAVNGKWCMGCALRAVQNQGSWLAKRTLATQGVTNKPFIAAGHTGHKH